MLEFFKRKKIYRKFTLTYFIPSPPERNSGYREKEFDELIYNLLSQDYELLDMKTQATSHGDKKGGMWIICIIAALTPQAAKHQRKRIDELGLKEINQNPELDIEYE